MQECDVCVYHDYLPDYPPCSNCLSEHDVSGGFPLFCETLSEDVTFETKQTNGDKIRSMSNEELAEWYFSDFFPNAPYCNKLECYRDSPCEQCLLDWLKQEV